MSAKTKWLLFAVSGLLLIGFGLSLLGEAIIIKFTQSGNWVIWGSLALGVTNTGICLFGQAIIEKINGKV